MVNLLSKKKRCSSSFGELRIKNRKQNWMVVFLPPLRKMMEFVNWDDDIPNPIFMGKCLEIHGPTLHHSRKSRLVVAQKPRMMPGPIRWSDDPILPRAKEPNGQTSTNGGFFAVGLRMFFRYPWRLIYVFNGFFNHRDLHWSILLSLLRSSEEKKRVQLISGSMVDFGGLPSHTDRHEPGSQPFTSQGISKEKRKNQEGGKLNRP